MALTDKNIVITPNVGQAADPKIVFSGADSVLGPQNITLQAYPTSNGTLSFEGSAGQLFSITNSLSGSIFSVNDVSGIPSIEVLDTGTVRIAQYSGNVGIGISDPGAKLTVVANTATDAVRITQIGAGNALLVEDSANPDSTPFVVAADGKVGVGTTSPTSNFTVEGLTEIRSGNYLMLRPSGNSWDMRLRAVSTQLDFYSGGDLVNPIVSMLNGGNVGIGVASPTVRLDVSGSIRASQSVTIGSGGGTYQAGSIYSDVNWGMIFRAARASPGTAEFMWANSAGTELFRFNGSALTTSVTGNAATVTNGVYTTGNQSIAGIKTFTTDVRSPIFYDSIDTGFYVDPNSESRLSAVLRTQSRVDNAQRYPIGHYTPGETVFELDPTWTENELRRYFNSDSIQWLNDSTSPGGYAIQINGAVNVGGVYGSGFPYIPVDQNDIFYMECWIRSLNGSQTHYMGSMDFNQAFTNLGGNPGSFGYWTMSNTNIGTTWTKVTGYITGFGTATGTFVSGTKYWTPQALFNYTQISGTHACVISGWKVIKVAHVGNRTFRGSIQAAGDITAYFSDSRLKTFIGTIDNSLEKIKKLNGYYFYENELAKSLGYTNEKRQVGLSAQEVQAVLPEIVVSAPISAEYLTVKYEKMTPLLVEAIKELDEKYQNIINDLKNQIESLRKSN